MTAPAKIHRPLEVLRDLPIDIENEKNLIWCLLRKPDLLRDESLSFSVEDFHFGPHKRIVPAMVDLDVEGVVPDPGMIANRLTDQSDRDYLLDLTETMWASPSNARYYSEKLREMAIRRLALFDADKLQKAALSGVPDDIAKVRSEIGNGKREYPEQTGKTFWVDAFDICQQPVTPVEWLVDRIFPRSGAGTVDGPPESGKSSLVVNMAATIANGGGCWFGQDCLSGPVVVLGGEKSSHAVWRRDFERLGKVTRPGSFLIPELDGPLWKWDRREGVWFKTPSYAEAVRGIKRIKPALVIGDTIMRLGLGIDQIDNAQQAALGFELEELAEEAGCLFLIIGHTNQASTKEALSWRLHYLSRAGGNGLPGVLRYCFAVTRIHRSDVQKNGELEGMFSPEEVSFRKLIACGVSKGNEIPPAAWTNNSPAFFEIMPSGQIMMLDKDRFVSDKPMVVDRAGCLKYPEHEGGYCDPLADL